MEARYQISTGREQIGSLSYPPGSQDVPPTLRFPTDSKTLSSFRSSPDSASVGIGVERAFTEAPPDIRRFHPQGR